MMTDEQIDRELMMSITHEWRKMSRVIGSTMMQIDPTERAGLTDLYFARRVSSLIAKGLVEFTGNIRQIRECEIRLPKGSN